MPRIPALKPRETPKGWELTVPASQSETGKRLRLYFKSERAAKVEASRRKRKMRKHGAKALHIPAELAEQALKAAAIVEQYGVSLVEVARDWAARRQQQEASITLAEAWVRGEEYRKDRRAETRGDYRTIGRNLPRWLMDKLVCDITPDECARAVAEVTGGPTMFNKYLRYMRAILTDAVKDGFADDNPASKVRKRSPEPKKVQILTVKQLKALFAACRDYSSPGTYSRDQLDCRPCAIAFAFLAFAGLRPKELVRLTWEDVSTELSNIRLSSPTTKTRTLRNVHIEDNLLAWIDTIPEKKRGGRIIPTDWVKRRATVHRESGLQLDQDVLRHSYGSYYLAAFDNLDTLNANMGHSHMKTFFDHYHNALTKREALPYWSIGPKGWEAAQVAIA